MGTLLPFRLKKPDPDEWVRLCEASRCKAEYDAMLWPRALFGMCDRKLALCTRHLAEVYKAAAVQEAARVDTPAPAPEAEKA